MMRSRKNFSTKTLARVTGVVYLLMLVLGVVAQAAIGNRLIAYDDASRTAANYAAHPGLYQLSFSLFLVEMALNIAQTALFYELLRPVNRALAVVATSLGLAGCVVKTVARLFYLAPLLVLGGDSYLNVFSAAQLRSLSLLLIHVNDHGAAIAMAFFGFYGVLKGWLIFRSEFWPRWLGVVSMIASAGWLTFVSATLGYRMFPVTGVLGLGGALVVAGYLLFAGVDEERWRSVAAGS